VEHCTTTIAVGDGSAVARKLKKKLEPGGHRCTIRTLWIARPMRIAQRHFTGFGNIAEAAIQRYQVKLQHNEHLPRRRGCASVPLHTGRTEVVK
jgi:hypothetical protein